MDTEAIPTVPAPWNLRGDIFMIPLWVTRNQAKDLPPQAYSPLEAASEFATSPLCQPVGGVGMVQIIRYRETPVGPYDEMALMPGDFAWRREDAQGRVIKKGRGPRITRVYVSQVETCYNGRINWNIPKHLARFDWDVKPDGATTVKIFPHDMNLSADPSESSPSTTPLFCATFQPMRYAPAFPGSTEWMRYFGQETTTVQPPLPQGQGSKGELPGTNRWCAARPIQSSRRTVMGWFDLRQTEDQETEDQPEDGSSFWPSFGRWRIGAKMEDAAIELGEPETWEIENPERAKK